MASTASDRVPAPLLVVAVSLVLTGSACEPAGCLTPDDCPEGFRCPLKYGICVPLSAWPDDAAIPDMPPPDGPVDMTPDIPDAAVETACDGLDDDEDGVVDEDLLNACGACGPPPIERCNDEDDDCDGRVDEGFRVGAPCPVGRLEACQEAGRRECAAGVEGEVFCRPMAGQNTRETQCDGVDDDCDGALDELLMGSAELPGVCAGLTLVCDARGNTRPPTPEERAMALGLRYEADETRCDNLDNDCDGRLDEAPRPVVPDGVGVCAGVLQVCCNARDPFCCPAPGSAECPLEEGVEGEAFGFSVPPVDGGHPESIAAQTDGRYGETEDADVFACDGADNDCDGSTDTEDADVTPPAASWVGARPVCAEATQVCARDGDAWGFRDPSPGELARQAMGGEFDGFGLDTMCDGTDADCDGRVDEGYVPAQPPVADRQPGVCGQARYRCEGGALVLPQSVAEYAMQGITWEGDREVTCDGQDNDCDGHVDETADLSAVAESAGLVGVCAPLTLVCQGGRWQAPGPMQRQAVEGWEAAPEASCDGLDNDCDGPVDEAITRACGPGPGVVLRAEGNRSVCVAGTQRCIGDGWDGCQGAVMPAPADACHDGVDQDCDGRVDEGCLAGPCDGAGDCPAPMGAVAWCDEPGAGGRCGFTSPEEAMGDADVDGCGCMGCAVCLDRFVSPAACQARCAPCRHRQPACAASGGHCAAAAGDAIDRCLSPCDADADCRPGWRCLDGHTAHVPTIDDMNVAAIAPPDPAVTRFCRPAP